LPQVGVSNFKHAQAQGIFSGFFIFLHEAAFLQGEEESIGGAAIEPELVS
jgi:hypothetical protein